MENRNFILGMVGGIIALILYLCLYTVDQRERAILFRFREIVNADIQPGLHFSWPFINSVKKFPAQIQTLTSNSERFLTGEKKYVMGPYLVSSCRMAISSNDYLYLSLMVKQNRDFRKADLGI